MSTGTNDLTPSERPSSTGERLGRVNLSVPVHLVKGGALLGVTQNVSLGGMFLSTPALLPVGDRLALRLAIFDDAEPVHVEAEVRWCRRFPVGARRPAGMGLRFVDERQQSALFVRVLMRVRERGRRDQRRP
jgi:uncharacterized protein (TIGR02266 family)